MAISIASQTTAEMTGSTQKDMIHMVTGKPNQEESLQGEEVLLSNTVNQLRQVVINGLCIWSVKIGKQAMTSLGLHRVHDVIAGTARERQSHSPVFARCQSWEELILN